MLVRILAVLLLAASVLASPATAHEYTLGDLRIVDPWARASAGAAGTGVAYLDIVNSGSAPDRLIGASTPAAAHAELHMHASENGIMKMRPAEAVDIAPGERIALKPGGFHLMLIGLVAPLAEGQSFPLTLVFEKAGTVEVSVEVAPVGAMHGGHHGGETAQ